MIYIWLLTLKHTSASVLLGLSSAADFLNLTSTFFSISGQMLQWLRSYLSESYQCFYRNPIHSESCDVTCGVPQGFILGALFFQSNCHHQIRVLRQFGITVIKKIISSYTCLCSFQEGLIWQNLRSVQMRGFLERMDQSRG